MKLWTGRLSGNMDEWAEILNNSLPYDQRLCLEDVEGSMAWAAALHQSGLLTEEEFKAIQQGLQTIHQMFVSGEFPFQVADEDIHSAVERQLTELIGDSGGKLHTGRSRNDQVATDFKLWTIKATKSVMAWLRDVQDALTERAEKDIDHIVPGYTHLQQAQPILLSHWWLSHFWALQRDFTHFQNLLVELDTMPLGSGALAGTGFSIDRHSLAESLHFSQACPNSLDAVHDRDFAVGFLFNASLLGIHLSQMAETLILFSTQEFNQIAVSDAFSTGSSIMPQKKNPDTLELIRGKSGFLLGKLMGFMATLKSLPSAYDKDLQEDKIAVFEAFDTLEIILKVTAGILKTLTVKPDSSNERIHPYMMATDLADELVLHGMPFRQAHHVVAAAVKFAEEQKIGITQIPLPAWQSFSPLIGEWVYQIFNARQSVKRRSAWGGTAPEAVNAQLAHARQIIQQQ